MNRKTISQIKETHKNIAAAAEKMGYVAEITYSKNGSFFQKWEKADGTTTKAIRVA